MWNEIDLEWANQRLQEHLNQCNPRIVDPDIIDEMLTDVHRRMSEDPVALRAEYRSLSLQKYHALEGKPLEASHTLDMIIIICGSDKLIHNLTFHALAGVHFLKLNKHDPVTLKESMGTTGIDTLRESAMTMDRLDTPFVSRKACWPFPACRKWRDPNHILEIGGHRLVPVEIGHDYRDPKWTQKIMTLGEYFRMAEPAYLAQFDLFSMLPRLEDDLEVDWFIRCLPAKAISRNIWIGVTETFTPFHWDKDTNVFCQIVGYKTFRILPPEALQDYCEPGSNSVGKDIPQEALAKCELVTLAPGDCLFIPAGWWHEVKSNGYNVSVSHWLILKPGTE